MSFNLWRKLYVVSELSTFGGSLELAMYPLLVGHADEDCDSLGTGRRAAHALRSQF